MTRPTEPIYQGAEYTEQLAQNWYQLAKFGARACAAGVLAPHYNIVLTLESGLEHDLNARPVAEKIQAEWSIKLTCAWLVHGSARSMLKWALENLEDGYRGGGLTASPRALCIRARPS